MHKDAYLYCEGQMPKDYNLYSVMRTTFGLQSASVRITLNLVLGGKNRQGFLRVGHDANHVRTGEDIG